MAFITNIESPYRCAIMEDWNWALGYGIGKDVETGKDIFVHHSFLEESVKERGACTGFSWINDKGEKISGAIGENTKWLERRDRIYYTTKPEYPNVAFNCQLYPHTNVVDIDEEIDTIGGLVFLLAGRIPQRGELITHPKDFEIEIREVDQRKIINVRFRLKVK